MLLGGGKNPLKLKGPAYLQPPRSENIGTIDLAGERSAGLTNLQES